MSKLMHGRHVIGVIAPHGYSSRGALDKPSVAAKVQTVVPALFGVR